VEQDELSPAKFLHGCFFRPGWQAAVQGRKVAVARVECGPRASYQHDDRMIAIRLTQAAGGRVLAKPEIAPRHKARMIFSAACEAAEHPVESY